MKFSVYFLAMVFLTVGCNSSENNKDTSAISDLSIVIEADDMITLPELEGIDVYLVNNSNRTINIWENVNRSGRIEVSFIFENNKNERRLIEPVTLNWKREFSKAVKIEAGEKFKLDPQLTHWTINNTQIEKTDTIIHGKLKAHYNVNRASEKDEGIWEGAILSNEVNVKLKHEVFTDKK